MTPCMNMVILAVGTHPKSQTCKTYLKIEVDLINLLVDGIHQKLQRSKKCFLVLFLLTII